MTDRASTAFAWMILGMIIAPSGIGFSIWGIHLQSNSEEDSPNGEQTPAPGVLINMSQSP